MNSVKNDLKIYQFIQTESLPVQVMSHLEKYFIPDEMPVVITELLKSLGEICERGFQVIDLTAEKINFKYPQTFLKFQTEAIKILKTDFSLFNNDFVDEAIYRIITEENDFDYAPSAYRFQDGSRTKALLLHPGVALKFLQSQLFLGRLLFPNQYLFFANR